MYAEFAYELLPGLLEVLQEFDLKPNGEERRRCVLLPETFICEIQNAGDYETIHANLTALRESLGNQFDYTLSLRRKSDPIRISATHNTALAQQIISG